MAAKIGGAFHLHTLMAEALLYIHIDRGLHHRVHLTHHHHLQGPAAMILDIV